MDLQSSTKELELEENGFEHLAFVTVTHHVIVAS